MAEVKRRWVLIGVSDQTREDVKLYAQIRGISVARVVDDEFKNLRARIAVIERVRRGWHKTDAGE